MLPMGAELLATVALAATSPGAVNFILLALVILIWISTAILSVPRHNKLTEIKNPRLISELVLTNWL